MAGDTSAVTVTPPKAPRGQSQSAINRRLAKERRAAEAAAAAGGDGGKVDAESVAQSAQLILTLAENIGIAIAGPDAAISDAERAMIEPALGPVLEKLTPAAVAQVSSFINPAMLLMGVALWGSRVAALATERAKAARAARRVSAPAAAPNIQPTTGPAANEPAADDDDGPAPKRGGDNLSLRPGEADARSWLRTQTGGLPV